MMSISLVFVVQPEPRDHSPSNVYIDASPMADNELSNHSSPRRVPTMLERRESLARLIAASRRSLRSDPDGARRLAEEALSVAEALNDRTSLAEAHRQLGLCQLSLFRFREGLPHLRQALRICDELEDDEGAADVALAIGHAHLRLGDPAAAIDSYNDALRRAHRSGYQELAAVAHTALGNAHVGIGEYATAVRHHRDALALREGSGSCDSTMLAGACTDIGVAYMHMGSCESAYEFFERAVVLARSIGDRYIEAAAIGGLSSACSALGRVEPARAYALHALLLCEQIGDRRGVAESMIRVATLDESIDPGAALELHRRAATVGRDCGDPALQATAIAGAAGMLRCTGDRWNAVAELESALRLAEASRDHALLERIHRMLAEIYEELGEHGSALRHFKLGAPLRDHVRSSDARRSVAEAETAAIIAGKERELEQSREMARQLRQELDERTKELAAMAIGAVQREEAFKTLTERLQESDGLRSDVLLGELIDRLEPASGGEEAWREFEEKLDRLHPEFVSRLRERWPKLTTTEVRICALLRGNMSTKEIADVLCTSERTIENHRYRMRRKMGLPAGENLTLILATI